MRAIDTNWLTRASFKPAAPHRHRRRWQIAAVVLLLLVVVAGHGFAGDFYVAVRDLAALREERTLLAAEVERLRTELAVESATRRELERQAAESNARVAELDGQVQFLRALRTPGKSAQFLQDR
jgi:hypothetical protein